MKKLLILFSFLSVIFLQTVEAKTIQIDGIQTELIVQTDAISVQMDEVISVDFDFSENQFIIYKSQEQKNAVLLLHSFTNSIEKGFMQKPDFYKDIHIKSKLLIKSFYRFKNTGGLSSGGSGGNYQFKKHI